MEQSIAHKYDVDPFSRGDKRPLRGRKGKKHAWKLGKLKCKCSSCIADVRGAKPPKYGDKKNKKISKLKQARI
jgi:hypothetical protein